ncbi:MAG TPA: hypothetical protein VFH74_03790 [Gaiellales bacterium]|nr:hypothetical protein [Gaiellales bacterium]
MKRASLIVALVVAGVVAGLAVFSGSGSAATGQVTHVRLRGDFAEAMWTTGSGRLVTQWLVNAEFGDLSVDEYVIQIGPSGEFMGATDTTAEVTSGFSFTRSGRFASAELSAHNLPAQTCTLDANGGVTGCRSSTISAVVSWSGTGAIVKQVAHDRSRYGQFTKNSHLNLVGRLATATGTVGGTQLSEAALDDAALGYAKAGELDLCVHNSC